MALPLRNRGQRGLMSRPRRPGDRQRLGPFCYASSVALRAVSSTCLPTPVLTECKVAATNVVASSPSGRQAGDRYPKRLSTPRMVPTIPKTMLTTMARHCAFSVRDTCLSMVCSLGLCPGFQE